MGMFDQYDNLDDFYVPSNVKPCPNICPDQSKLDSCLGKKPYEEYNAEGELIGYWWYYGDTINLDFNITGEVIVEDNAIVYYAIGEKPDIHTIGAVGQKAYNIKDYISWTCIAVDYAGVEYIWQQDEEFEPLQEGQRCIYVTAEEFLKDKQITVELFNFRRERVAIKTFNGNQNIVFPIDEELAKKLVKGVYYCSLSFYTSTGLSKTLFQQEDCSITIK